MQLQADLGQRLKELRTKQNLTQEQLASRLGVRKSVISYYEAGTRCPSYEVLKSIARVFNVTTDFLLGVAKPDNKLDTSGLTEEEIAAVASVIEVIRNRK